jgi:hypothetical protein
MDRVRSGLAQVEELRVEARAKWEEAKKRVEDLILGVEKP